MVTCWAATARGTTTSRAIMGLASASPHRLDQRSTAGHRRLAPHHIAALGVGYCPEERGIFATSLGCEENLMLPPQVAEGGGMSVEEICAMFQPEERRNSPGGRLSGGEQQMLAVARILRTGKMLLLDRDPEGLAPSSCRPGAHDPRAARGFTVLMVEQNFRFAAPLGRPLLHHGRGLILREFTAAELPGQHGHAAPVSGREPRSPIFRRLSATIASLAPPHRSPFPHESP